MISKVLICPYFGALPSWYEHWLRNTERMLRHGYDFLFDTDEADFQKRVKRTLGIECPPMTGTGRFWKSVSSVSNRKSYPWWRIRSVLRIHKLIHGGYSPK